MASTTPIIEFTQVTKRYGHEALAAVRDLSFNVAPGEFFCIIGPSGCGKSTVLKLITGLETVSGGTIRQPPNVSMVFQAGALFPWLTVRQNILVGQRVAGPVSANASAEPYLSMVGLGNLGNRYPRELSGGQRQRVGIARALAAEPTVLVLDEAFSALDIGTTEELHQDLLKLWRQTGKTIVMVSHSIEEAVTLADRIMLMKAGRKVQEFAITLERPRRDQAHAFIEEVQRVRKVLLKP